MALGVAIWGVRRIVQQSQPSVLHLLGRLVLGLVVPARASGGPGCGGLAFGDPSSQDVFWVGQLGFLVAEVSSPASCLCIEVHLSTMYPDLLVTLLTLSPFMTKYKRRLREEIQW